MKTAWETVEQGNKGAHNELIATIWLLKQGYHVFRNVSSHGPVDIVAMKDGEIALFDVKAVYWNAAGEKNCSARLHAEQIALGVKIIAVYPDGDCEINHEPRPYYEQSAPVACRVCAKEFVRRNSTQLFCGSTCRNVNKVAVTAARLEGERQ